MKKQLLIFILLLAGILSVDLTPVSFSDPENTEIHVSIKGAVEKEETITLMQRYRKQLTRFSSKRMLIFLLLTQT